MLLVTLISMFAGAALSTSAQRDERLFDLENAQTHFEQFILDFNRQYANEQEKQMRFEIFKQNLKEINKRNTANEDAEFGITKFTDWTDQEFARLNRARKVGVSNCTKKQITIANAAESEETWDWRQQNAVTRVKNQKNCGSCWAFSTTGNIEGQYAIKHGKLLEFSEQQMVDCNKRGGCIHGSYVSNALYDVIQNGGLESEADYPYVARGGKCHFDKSKVKVKVQECLDFTHTSEDQLMHILRNVGPLSIVIDAIDLKFHKKNIITTCKARFANHAVLLVGYGTENNIPYWIIKNSYGEDFGENGYFRILRGKNLCGIRNYEIVTSVL